MIRRVVSIVLASAFAVFLPSLVEARVTAFTITSRTDVLGGAPFAVGPYEKIVGTATFSDDPTTASNRGVIDLALAPRDANS